MINVLFFIDQLSWGGRERRLVELLKSLSSSGEIECGVVLMSRNVHYQEIFSLNNVKVHYLERHSKKDFTTFFKFFSLCREIKPDIIHVWDSMTAVIALPTTIVLRKKLLNSMIASAPTQIETWSKSWIRARLTFPFSDVITSNSIAGINAFHAPQKKTFCVYNGFNPERLRNLVDQQTIRLRFGITTSRIVGMVAEFAPRKDYETYIRAAKRVLKERNDVTFLAVGDGPTLDEAKRMVDVEKLERFKFLGRQRDIESIVNTFDVGVLVTNSLLHGEGISNAILEYMSLGKPVIATDGGGTREIVEDQITGYLIPPFNDTMLAEKLLFMFEHPDEAQSIGAAAQRLVRNKFSMHAMTNSFVEIYKALFENR